MTVFYESEFFAVSGRVIPAPAFSRGLGRPLALLDVGASTFTGLVALNSTEAIQTALDDADLTATQAALLTSMLSQAYAPEGIDVYMYSTTAVGVAASAALAAGASAGLIYVLGSDAALADLGTWHATGDRFLKHFVIALTTSADAITDGQPAALDTITKPGFYVVYHETASALHAAALAGAVAGFPLVNGPIGIEGANLSGVTPPTLTQAQYDFAQANRIGVLLPRSPGVGSTTYLNRGPKTYAAPGIGAKPMISLVYTVRRCIEDLSALKAERGITMQPIVADATGVTLVEARLSAVLTELRAHFTPGTSGTPPNEEVLPEGWSVRVENPLDGELYAYVLVRLGREVYRINLDVTGEEV